MRRTILTTEERKALRDVLERSEPTVVLVHGEGSSRDVSFYAQGTRLEARISVPDGSEGERLAARLGPVGHWSGLSREELRGE